MAKKAKRELQGKATHNAVASMINEGTANDVFRSLRLRKGEGGVRICSSSITHHVPTKKFVYNI